MKKPDYKITGWQKSFCSFNSGTFLSIACIILPFGLLGSNWAWWGINIAAFQVISLLHWFSLILASVNNAIISVVVCTLVLIFAAVGTYIKKLLKDLDTKDRAIIGLREIIRLLEERQK